MELESFYNTLWELSEAVEAAYNVTVPTIYGGIAYGETLKLHIEPEGRKRKWTHVVITRMDSGRYELVSYQL